MRSVTMWTPLALIVVLVGVLTGCGANADRAAVAADGGAAAGGAGGARQLSVAYDAGDSTAPVTWTLDCATTPATGSHPDPPGACADLAEAEDPFAEPDPDLACTEIWGGPQTAHVTGTWQGDPVDAVFDRTNGCRIAQWDAAGRLLPAPPDTGLTVVPEPAGS